MCSLSAAMPDEVKTLHAFPNEPSLASAIDELSTSNCFEDLGLLDALKLAVCLQEPETHP